MFDGLKQNGAKWDVIGMSLYPDWITDQTWEQVSDACLDNIKSLSGKYNCDVIISEIGMVWNSRECRSIPQEDGGWLQGHLYLRGRRSDWEPGVQQRLGTADAQGSLRQQRQANRCTRCFQVIG